MTEDKNLVKNDKCLQLFSSWGEPPLLVFWLLYLKKVELSDHATQNLVSRNFRCIIGSSVFVKLNNTCILQTGSYSVTKYRIQMASRAHIISKTPRSIRIPTWISAIIFL